jgi:hypothetical protein
VGLWGCSAIAGWTTWRGAFGANKRIPARLNPYEFFSEELEGLVWIILNSLESLSFRVVNSLLMSHFFQLDLLNSTSKGL